MRILSRAYMKLKKEHRVMNLAIGDLAAAHVPIKDHTLGEEDVYYM